MEMMNWIGTMGRWRKASGGRKARQIERENLMVFTVCGKTRDGNFVANNIVVCLLSLLLLLHVLEINFLVE